MGGSCAGGHLSPSKVRPSGETEDPQCQRYKSKPHVISSLTNATLRANCSPAFALSLVLFYGTQSKELIFLLGAWWESHKLKYTKHRTCI